MGNLTEKALTILEKTNDGNLLSPGDLYLVQEAVNGHLSQLGVVEFNGLFKRVVENRYEQSWMYGIEGLTRKHGGYIAWRGKIVEHYSYHDDAKEREAAEELAARCRALEKKGFPVNGSTASGLSPFKDAPAGTPWVTAMSSYYTALADINGKCTHLILHLSDNNAVAMCIIAGEIVLQYGIYDGFDSGAYVLYHALQDKGLKSVCDRLRTYSGFVKAMDEAGITPEAVNRVLNACHSHILKGDATCH